MMSRQWDAMGGPGVEMVNTRFTSLLIKIDERTLRRLDERRPLSAQRFDVQLR
jgi:hypothetical protein